LIYYVSTVPKIVYYPLLIMVFGVGPESKVAKGVLSAFFPIVVLVTAGALEVNPVHRNVARTYNASRLQTFRKVYIPSTVTYVLNGMRLGIGTAIISVMLAELFVSKAGLGNQLQFYFSQLQMGKMYAVLLIVFVTAFALNLGLLRVQSYLVAKGYGTGEGGEQGFGF
jgi:ABC-type nitrate/sulfonate/bicarbonate transport system permease component